MAEFIVRDGRLTDRVEETGFTEEWECIIPEGVRCVDAAFLTLSGAVRRLYIPASVEQIESGAFSGCERLGEIAVSSDNPFFHVSGGCLIETATRTLILGGENSAIPADGRATTIAAFAFHGRKALTQVTVPACIVRVGYMAFAFSGLTRVTLADGVEEIDAHAFAQNDGLTELHLPGSVIRLGRGIVSACNRLHTLTVAPENPRYRSEGECIIDKATDTLVAAGLTDAVPNGVRGIGERVFFMCDERGSVYIPESVAEIGEDNFVFCPQLSVVTLCGSYAEAYARERGIPVQDL